MANKLNELPKRNPGSFSISDDKLRIQNKDGQSSVLFEDISSITWEKKSIPNLMFVIAGTIMFFLGPFFFISVIEGDSAYLVPVLLGIGIAIYGYLNKIIWEDVIVETRGGKLLSYSVDQGMGQKDVDQIESNKRKLTMNK